MTQYWNYWNRLISTIQYLESIADPNEKEKAAKKYFEDLIVEYSKDVNFFMERILELNSDIELINVPTSLMDSLKEALFCYINGQYLSAIASTGIASELFCVHIYQLFLQNIGLGRLQIKRRMNSFRKISQSEKIDTLHSVIGLDESVCGTLHEIRQKRNDSVHPGEGYNYKSDALDCLQNLVDILNSYSESQKQAIKQAQEEGLTITHKVYICVTT